MNNDKKKSKSDLCSPSENIEEKLRDLRSMLTHAREIEKSTQTLVHSLQERSINYGSYLQQIKTENKFIKNIQQLENPNMGISVKRMSVARKQLFVLYIQELTNREMLSQFLIGPILKYDQAAPLDIDILHNSIINLDDVTVDSAKEKTLDYILKGYSVIIVDDNEEEYLVANTIKIEKRTTQSPEIEQTLWGSRDAFTENINSNLSLIRYRIKDPSLIIYKCLIGERTKTNVAVVYIDDIANQEYVNKVIKKINSINTDGILETGMVQKFLLNNTFDLFPQTGLIEKSATACQCILEGKICILVEGSNLSLIAPKTFFEFFVSSDDNYGYMYLGILAKLLRFISAFCYLSLSSLYIAIVAFHFDILPPQYALAMAVSRATVPFNAFTEVLIMEIATEILRESSIRIPKNIGPTIGIVGAIVIGQAAVSAGLISPLVIIITSLSTMCSFVIPDNLVINPFRIMKFMLLVFTGILGLFGFTMGLNIIFINLVSQSSFGIPYFSPLAPFNFSDLKNFILGDLTLAKKRPGFLKTPDNTRL
ncbi:MAG: spore germination protein [Firmicutes bacterium]|nr:spore germination protein [Bacillota bacterium]